MKFKVKEWRKMYDQVQELGKLIKASTGHYDKEGHYVEPEMIISNEYRKEVLGEIESLLQRNNRYLTQCGLRRPRPLWQYYVDKPETHASSKKFKYAHLIQD